MSAHILPDSRLKDSSLATVMADWENPDGSFTRMEMQPVYCASCGIHYGWVPVFTTFACWLCNQCHEQYGVLAGTYVQPEEEFNQAVAQEMLERFGRSLTDLELFALMEQGKLGIALENLNKESPYKVMNNGNR